MASMTLVTDPQILAQLNGNSLERVSDPDILSQLNSDTFSDRIGQDWKARSEAVTNPAKGSTPYIDPIISSARIGVGMPFDFAGEALKSGYRALPSDWQSGISNAVKSASEATIPFEKNGLTYGEVGKEAASGLKNFSEAHPTLSNALGYATELPVSPSLTKAASSGADIVSSGLRGAGDYFINSADKTVNAKRFEGIAKGVMPDTSTVAGREEAIQGGGVEVKRGILGKDIIPKPDKFQQETIQEVANLSDVNPKNLHVENADAIDKAIGVEADTLKKDLQKNDIDLSVRDPQFPTKIDNKFSGILDNIVNQISEHETIRGNANKIASDLANKMHGFMANEPQTISGLLEARKQFDAFVRKEMGKFPEDAGAMGSANKQVRDAVNNFISEMSPSSKVKESLAKQSALFRGRDAYEAKARKQLFGKGERAADKISKAHDLRGQALKAAALAAGVGGAALVPQVALPAAALYGLGKGVAAPVTRKAFGETLKAAGSIKPTIEEALKFTKGKK